MTKTPPADKMNVYGIIAEVFLREKAAICFPPKLNISYDKDKKMLVTASRDGARRQKAEWHFGAFFGYKPLPLKVDAKFTELLFLFVLFKFCVKQGGTAGLLVPVSLTADRAFLFLSGKKSKQKIFKNKNIRKKH